MHRIELDITEQCNLRCTACVRSSGVAPSTKQMTVEQVEKFVNDSINLHWKWESIMLIGGEPTMHPLLFDIINAIKKYKNYHKKCLVKLMTNGSRLAEAVLPKIPSWIVIINNSQHKLKNDQNHHLPFNVAPIDVGEWDEANLIKCNRPFRCGMGLTRDGYFACHNAGGIHRVFGLDGGIKALKDVTFKKLDSMIPLSCKYCGFYFEADERYKKFDIHLITKSWKSAYKKFNTQDVSKH
jgi:hypothetical protein